MCDLSVSADWFLKHPGLLIDGDGGVKRDHCQTETACQMSKQGQSHNSTDDYWLCTDWPLSILFATGTVSDRRLCDVVFRTVHY